MVVNGTSFPSLVYMPHSPAAPAVENFEAGRASSFLVSAPSSGPFGRVDTTPSGTQSSV